jgi:hypothetical protein
MSIADGEQCPRCEKFTDRLLALSRRADVNICEECGSIEAMNDAEPFRQIPDGRVIDEMIFHKKMNKDVKEWVEWKKSPEIVAANERSF